MTTADGNGVGISHAHRAMWMDTIRDSLERSVPIASDDIFDDLLAQLDEIPSGPSSSHAATPDKRATMSLARRDAALETHLSGYVDLLAKVFGRLRGQFAAREASPCRENSCAGW